MNIALISIGNSSEPRSAAFHLHTVKTFLESRSGGRFRADILPFSLSDSPAVAAARIVSGGYRVALFHLLHWNTDLFHRIVSHLEKSEALVGVWGHDSFAYPDRYLTGAVRFIVPDEPELPLYETTALLEEGGDIGKAADIIFRDDIAKTYRHGTRRVIDPLDLIPSPYLAGVIPVTEDTSVFWEVSRGCLFRCDFCVDFSHAAPVRHHSFRYLEAELALFRERGVRHIVIGAPLFNLSRQHFMKTLDLLEEYLPEALVEMQVRPDLLSREEIQRLATMRVVLHFGIPSFHPKLLEQATTSLNGEKAVQNIRQMNNHPDLPFTLDLIGGLPQSSFADAAKDIERAFSLWPVRINLYRLSLYPGTRVYNRMREYDLKIEHRYPWRITDAPAFPRRDLQKIDDLAEGIETLYNRGRLVSVFSMLAKALDLSATDLIERWNRYRAKAGIGLSPESDDFDDLYGHIIAFFKHLFEKLQRRKLWPLAEDLLVHNRFYTQSLLTPDEDRITFPYQTDSLSEKTPVGINRSAFVHRFSYNIEDVLDAGFLDLRRYTAESEKEHLYGLVYRIEGGVFTRTLSEREGELFAYLAAHGETPLGKLRRKVSGGDIEELVIEWCEAGALYLAAD